MKGPGRDVLTKDPSASDNVLRIRVVPALDACAKRVCHDGAESKVVHMLIENYTFPSLHITHSVSTVSATGSNMFYRRVLILSKVGFHSNKRKSAAC